MTLSLFFSGLGEYDFIVVGAGSAGNFDKNTFCFIESND